QWHGGASTSHARSRAYAIHHYKLSWLPEDERRAFQGVPRVAAMIDSLPRAGRAVVIGGWLSTALRTQRDVFCLGQYEHPSSSAEGVELLERARSDGAVLLVFLEPAFWWFDVYPDFVEHVRSVGRAVFSDETVRIFELHAPA